MFKSDKKALLFSLKEMNVDKNELVELMVQAANDKTEISAKEANDKIRQIFAQILELPENYKNSDIRRALRHNSGALYALIEEVIPQAVRIGWAENPYFERFVEYRNLNYGDRNEFYPEDEKYLTLSRVSGGHHDILRQRLTPGTPYHIETSWYAAKVYTYWESYMAGRIDFAGLIQKVYEAFDRHLNTMIAGALASAPATLPAQSVFNISGSLDKDTLLKLCRDVADATGANHVIMATRETADKILDLEASQWISADMKTQRNTLGRNLYFRGYELFEIPNAFADKTFTTKLVDADGILVVPSNGEKFIKVVDEGEGVVTSIEDHAVNMDMSYEFEYQQKMGAGIVMGGVFGYYDISE